jgi:hypothetical protein
LTGEEGKDVLAEVNREPILPFKADRYTLAELLNNAPSLDYSATHAARF